MKISTAKWEKVIEATRSNIDRLNDYAKKQKMEDRLFVHVTGIGEGGSLLVTGRNHGFRNETKAVVRFDDGRLRPATVKRKGNMIKSARVKNKSPKAWERLIGKSPADLVKGLGIASYTLIRFMGASSSSTSFYRGKQVQEEEEEERTTTTYLVYGFDRRDHQRRVSMIVDVETYSGKQYAEAERIAGPDYCFHASENVTESVPRDCKGVLFHSDDELYARVPELDLRPKKTRKAVRQ